MGDINNMLKAKEKRIKEILIEVNIFPNLKGFNYIVDAIDEINLGAKSMTEIYENIAANNKAKYSSVERGIRTAFSHCNKESLSYKKYFGNSVSNSERLFTLCCKINNEFDGENTNE
jgi:hypothetical protein